jgi:peroxiredoxin
MLNKRPAARFRALLPILMAAGSLHAQGAQRAQDAHPDPRALLEQSRAACLALESVRYHGRFEEFGERHGAGVMVADVALARGDGVTSSEVRFRVEGQLWARERTSPTTLDAAFDGEFFRRRDTARRSVVERHFEDLGPGRSAWAMASGYLGAGGSGVVLWSLVNTNPLRRFLAGEAFEYEGRTAVLGVLCEVVVIPGDAPHKIKRVFLGVDDHLPRKIEVITVMLTDRISGSILTLSDLRVGGELSTDLFHLSIPEGYSLVPQAAPVEKDTLLAAGEPAPAFTLRDPAGVEHSLADLRGRVVVLDFWGTWCGPCIRKLPEIQGLHAANRERPVTVIGISCHEPPNGRPAEVMELWGCEFQLLLEGAKVATAYGVPAFPSVVIIAPDGTIAFSQRGGAQPEVLQAAVEAALEGERD